MAEDLEGRLRRAPSGPSLHRPPLITKGPKNFFALHCTWLSKTPLLCSVWAVWSRAKNFFD